MSQHVHEIPGDPLKRVIIEAGITDWQDFYNDNLVTTVHQVNELEKMVTDTRIAFTKLEEMIAENGRPYDFSVFVPGQPPAGVTTLRAVVPPGRIAHIKSGKVGAVSCRVSPAKSVVLEVTAAGARVGEVTLSAGQTRGQVIFSEKVILQPFDVLEIAAPAEADEALEDLAIAISAGTLRADEIPDPDKPCD